MSHFSSTIQTWCLLQPVNCPSIPLITSKTKNMKRISSCSQRDFHSRATPGTQCSAQLMSKSFMNMQEVESLLYFKHRAAKTTFSFEKLDNRLSTVHSYILKQLDKVTLPEQSQTEEDCGRPKECPTRTLKAMRRKDQFNAVSCWLCVAFKMSQCCMNCDLCVAKTLTLVILK